VPREVPKKLHKGIDMGIHPDTMASMKVYSHIDVDMSYQNFGSAWCCILRGSTENINLVFNAFYNWGATNGDIQFYDHVQTVAVFWTDEQSLARCFYRMRINSPKYRHLGKQANWAHVHACMNELRNHHEPFLNFADMYVADTYHVGTITAERPDNDMKDAIIANAHKDKAE